MYIFAELTFPFPSFWEGIGVGFLFLQFIFYGALRILLKLSGHVWILLVAFELYRTELLLKRLEDDKQAGHYNNL